MTPEEIGWLIKKYRNNVKPKLTQTQLGMLAFGYSQAEANAAQSKIKNIEAGIGQNFLDIVRISRALKIDLSVFLDGNDIHLHKTDAPPQWPIEFSIEIEEAIGMIAKIFKSRNQVLIRAISANLMAFSETVETQGEIIKMRKEQQAGQSRMAMIEKRLDELEAENEALKKRLDCDAASNHR